MEKRRSRGELLENEDSLIDAEIIDHLSEAILENVFVGLMFEMHRNISINKLVGLREELLPEQTKDEIDKERKGTSVMEEPCVVPSNGRTTQRGGKRSTGGRSRGAGECKCKCFVCHQMIAAVRFAPHLEKCIGIGRAARSRRRGAGNNFLGAATDAFVDMAELSSPGRSTRSSTLRSAARRLFSGGNSVAGGDATASASQTTAAFVSRRRPPLVAEDFILPAATTTVTSTTKETTFALFTTDDIFKTEESDQTTEEPLRDRLRNKANRGTSMLMKK